MPKRSNSIKRLFFLKNSKFLELPNAKQKGVLKSSHNFSFINQSQRIWSFFQKIQVSFTFQYQMKKKININHHLSDKSKKQISLWETAILILSDFFFWLMGKTKINFKRIFGSFWNRYTHRPFLVSPWCMPKACSVRLQSRIHGPNNYFSSWQYWSQKQKSPPKGIETKRN